MQPDRLVEQSAHLLVRAVWLGMVLLAVSSRFFGFVDRLGDHGKLLRPLEGLPSLQVKLLRLMVPKKLFAHFYVVASIWPCGLAYHLLRYGSPTWSAMLCLLLLELHGLRRLYESLFVFRYGQAEMHAVAYVVGVGHYLLCGISLAVDPSCQSSGGQSAMLSWAAAVAGVAMFALGSYHQWMCHRILGSLRKTATSVAVGEHSLPQGDWFELVTCPHYLAECLIYTGIFVAGGLTNWTALTLLLWVWANLVITAQKTRAWYLIKFDKFPRDKKAIIPMLY